VKRDEFTHESGWLESIHGCLVIAMKFMVVCVE
jgi:hypothetical protein